MLKGQGEAYQYLWASLIKPLILSEGDISISAKFPVIRDESVELNLKYADSVTAWQVNGTNLSPMQDIHIPTHWSATYWPDSIGWHQSVVNKDSTWLYVSDHDTYNSMRAFNTRQANLIFDLKSIDQQQISYWQEVNLIWFYLLFLLSVGYLWLEPKLS